VSESHEGDEERAMSEAPDDAIHIPVLAEPTLELLNLQPGAVAVDVTAGAGGHLRRIAEAVGPEGRVIALDRDPRAHEDSAAGGVAKELSDRVVLVEAPFSELEAVLADQGVAKVDALLADLGVSSMQLDEDVRGFSFMRDGPLDMRMGPDAEESAWELIAALSEEELANVIYEYGEERKSRRIARAIKRAWPLPDSTSALADVVARAMGGRRGRIHPATRTFQALRIAVNRELGELDALLDQLPRVLAPGGRGAVISFHSLEDRRVKRRFLDGGSAKLDGTPPLWKVLTKRPVQADDDEKARNPRARSAKLRAVERLP
jgi:16S rRNA (cytosine1402-N4)-methyltransferase